MPKLKGKRDISKLRDSGKILAETLGFLREATIEGISLFELDEIARIFLAKKRAHPAFLGYKQEGTKTPYPAAICASVNEIIVHGVPSGYQLKNGDVLKIDLGVEYNGYVTDSAITIPIGNVSKRTEKLISTTKEALDNAIGECVPGKHLGDIGFVIQRTVEKKGFKVVRGLTGHGVGFELHEDPAVYNFGDRGEGMKLVPGLVLAIEPMVSSGSSNIVQLSNESFVTKDGSVSAHFEHTVAITKNGPEVLTR